MEILENPVLYSAVWEDVLVSLVLHPRPRSLSAPGGALSPALETLETLPSPWKALITPKCIGSALFLSLSSSNHKDDRCKGLEGLV